ncbi:MAG: Flp pilus assembly protein CpaB [Verrucomicrobiota bacterium]
MAAVVLGVVTAVLIWKYMRGREDLDKANWVPVVVAAVDIKPRTKITREMIRFESFPKELVSEVALRRVEDVVDRTTQMDISNKEQIRSTSLLAPGQSFGLSLKVPDGMRAIAIGASEISAVGTSVQPGDHVDIIATYFDPRTKQDVTKIIMQNLLVLAVNRGDTEAGSKGGGAQSSMTLAVKPDQTELLKAAERSGTMSVTLRSYKDKEIIQPTGVTPRDLASGVGQGDEAPVVETNDSRSTPVIFVNPQSRNAPQKETEIKVFRGTDERSTVIGK